MDEVTAWQNRPLEPCYPIVFMDANSPSSPSRPSGISFRPPSLGHRDYAVGRLI